VKATEQNQGTPTSRDWAGISLMFPIVGSHVRRIGILRTAAGLLPMYTAIPFLVVTHVTTAIAGYQWLLKPLFGTAPVRWADHVIIDRHRIAGLPAIDKFNCMFCGYANGLCTMINTELDHLAQHEGRLQFWKWPLVTLVAVPLLLWLAITEVAVQLIYNVLVSRPLGMHRTSMAEANAVLRRENYAGGHPALRRIALRTYKSAWLRFSLALEQIESSWCPLQHFEKRAGVVYPKHHAKFFGPDEIEEMRRVLATVGTVSDRRPTW
jgi:hypothetical protein